MYIAFGGHGASRAHTLSELQACVGTAPCAANNGYSFVMTEGFVGPIGQISAIDIDDGANGVVEFSVDPAQNAGGLFFINSTTGMLHSSYGLMLRSTPWTRRCSRSTRR